MTRRYRLLALDIDGTLLDETGTLRDRTRTAVRAAAEAGMAVVLASGRSVRQMRPHGARLGLPTPLVAVGGALVRGPADHSRGEDGETWDGRPWDRAVAERLLSLIAARGLAAVVTVLGHYAAEYLCLRGRPADAYDEPKMSAMRGVLHFIDTVREIDPAAVLRITVHLTPEHAAEVEAILSGPLAGKVRHHVIAAPDVKYPLWEIFAPDVHKWSGLTAVMARLGIAPGEVIAVGDDANDLQMIRAAGLGVAMGNAIPELKAAAKRVIGRHSEDGLARFIEGELV
jgi:HAD superfamily hydrolase (TIGR01484 family)